MSALIRDYLKTPELGTGATYENMAVFPVFAEQTAPSRYLSHDEALENGLLKITEVSEAEDIRQK
jgi:hypothetical protein